MVSAGTKLGPYEVAGSLGLGGMGEVYRARDLKLGREVALKQRADGSMPAEPLMKAEPKTTPVPEAWSPDGKYLLFTTTQGATSALWVLSKEDGTARPFGDVTSNALIATMSPTFSPDGRWVAYVASMEATRASAQIFVQPFPPTGIRYLVVSGGADRRGPPMVASWCSTTC